MKHQANPGFWGRYQELAEAVRRLADAAYELLRQNPRHPSLHFKRIGRFWSVRVTTVVWFWIGPHSEYNRIVGLA